MKTNTAALAGLPAKLTAVLLIAACLVVGAIGILLPIIPGFLFLGIAALVAARHFPAMDGWLRRNRGLGRHLDRADDYLALGLWRKVQLAGLVCVKLTIDGLVALTAGVRKLLELSRRPARRP